MTKRDFFKIIIKLFGLYALILTVFYYLPSNVSFVALNFEPIILLWIFGVFLLTVIIYIFLIRKTDRIIDLLKIDKGFDDERIELKNFSNQKIIKLALIVIGGFLIIDHTPIFLQHTYLAFKKEVSPSNLSIMDQMNFGNTVDYFKWGVSGINLIIGYILLTNYKQISKWLTRKDKNGD